MTLQLTTKSITIFEKHKSEVDASDLLDGLGKTVDNKNVPIIPSLPNFDKWGFVFSERFIKFIPSEKSLSLLANHPNAFLLLTLIACRARRTIDPLCERQIGEAYIGDWQACGLTRQKYRTALKFLCEKQILEIVVNKKLVEKSTTKATTNGTIVKLLKSDVWDINSETTNHQINHQPTIKQPSSNHKQERIRKKKKEKEEIAKKSYREKVFLTDQEFETLQTEHGEVFLSTMLDELNSYKCLHGKDYASDYHTMVGVGWVLKKCKKLKSERENPPSHGGIKEQILNRFQNGKFYNGAECFIDNDCISFQRGMTHKSLKFKEFGFWDQFHNILRSFGIPNE